MHQSPDILASFGDWETRMERALASVRAGRGVLVVDDEDRENEGDLIYPAHSLTDAQMARLIRHCSGIVCLCLTDERATRLGLPPMVAHNTNTQQTAFTISIEAAEGVTTGVSAADRVTTIKAAVADALQAAGLPMFAAMPFFSGYTTGNLLNVLYICVFVTAGGYACYFMGMEATSAMQGSLVFFFKPVLAPILAMLILGEEIPWNMWAGIGLMLVASVVSMIPTWETLLAVRPFLIERILHRQH